VLVEPTGLAALADITTTVRELMPDVDEIRALTLIDAERWETLAHIVEPLIA
jgi:G3E family GTPase